MGSVEPCYNGAHPCGAVLPTLPLCWSRNPCGIPSPPEQERGGRGCVQSRTVDMHARTHTQTRLYNNVPACVRATAPLVQHRPPPSPHGPGIPPNT